MGKKHLQKIIRDGKGFILSTGTLNLEHLLPKAYDVIISYRIYSLYPLAHKIAEVIKYKGGVPASTACYYGYTEISNEEEAGYLWHEDVFNMFNELAPKGYYFGSQEGDGACIGWWDGSE